MTGEKEEILYSRQKGYFFPSFSLYPSSYEPLFGPYRPYCFGEEEDFYRQLSTGNYYYFDHLSYDGNLVTLHQLQLPSQSSSESS